MGSRFGSMVFSSRIMGQDSATGELPDDPKLQAEFAFKNMKALMGGYSNNTPSRA